MVQFIALLTAHLYLRLSLQHIATIWTYTADLRAVIEYSRSRVWGKVPVGSSLLLFWRYLIFLIKRGRIYTVSQLK